ncbi:hypothetical protein J40TS1_14260 [Paenibacillus montaniterrae]|uniref:Cytochrome c domain-containing protein n=1 Tax=Paenibacillus montaniterrae TaxID=429341 RepID=A0A919YPB1_9BACL|nr:cytochrome c [Paenibacillus montaniterrae]GIP15784.1 hypothetical protein J40TS1_14260 [Paenibacillus montaniterrae]
MKSSKLMFVLLFAVILLSACGDQKEQKQSGDIVTLKQAPADVEAIYKARCISCHAIDLSGKMGEQTNLQQVHVRLSYDEIAAKISMGGKTMPAFEESLSAEEINALAAWLSKQ